jgi:hypothetical protein
MRKRDQKEARYGVFGVIRKSGLCVSIAFANGSQRDCASPGLGQRIHCKQSRLFCYSRTECICSSGQAARGPGAYFTKTRTKTPLLAGFLRQNRLKMTANTRFTTFFASCAPIKNGQPPYPGAVLPGKGAFIDKYGRRLISRVRLAICSRYHAMKKNSRRPHRSHRPI